MLWISTVASYLKSKPLLISNRIPDVFKNYYELKVLECT